MPPPLPPGLYGVFETSPSKTKTSSPICTEGPAPYPFQPPHSSPLTTLSLSSIPILTTIIIPALHPSSCPGDHVLPVSRDELDLYLLSLMLQPTSKPS